MRLGNIERAKACFERELLVSRRFHIMWNIPRACLGYAAVLFCAGEYKTAYNYLLEALSFEAHAPIINASIATIGLPLSLHAKDEPTIAKCARLSVIDAALRSGQVGNFVSATTAFAEWHAFYKRPREAENLLHRALEKLASRKQLNIIYLDFPLAVARFGALSDIPQTRELLRFCAAPPGREVETAHLVLFDAFVAERRGEIAEAQLRATDAAGRFITLGWYGYADLAQTLLPNAVRASTVPAHKKKPLGDTFAMLTMRERQVAELALKGMRNRAIAVALSISENTVESHMASIMNRLGIRSRFQLVDVLSEEAV